MAELCIVMFLVVGDILAVQCTAQPEGEKERRDAETRVIGDEKETGKQDKMVDVVTRAGRPFWP